MSLDVNDNESLITGDSVKQMLIICRYVIHFLTSHSQWFCKASVILLFLIRNKLRQVQKCAHRPRSENLHTVTIRNKSRTKAQQ